MTKNDQNIVDQTYTLINRIFVIPIIMNLDNVRIVKQILHARRRRRITDALSKVKTNPNTSVIDIGCGLTGRSFEDFIPSTWSVTAIDLADPQSVKHTHPNFKYIQQDAQDLSQFTDSQFDLAVSVGMLEHITEKTAFEKTVSEIRRVAKQHIVIVPYKYALIEPHYGFPLFPIYPNFVKRLLVKTFNINNQREAIKRDPAHIEKYCKWPSNKDYKKEFYESNIYLTPTLEQIVIIKSQLDC